VMKMSILRMWLANAGRGTLQSNDLPLAGLPPPVGGAGVGWSVAAESGRGAPKWPANQGAQSGDGVPATCRCRRQKRRCDSLKFLVANGICEALQRCSERFCRFFG